MREIVREIGVMERDIASWKLEERGKSAFPGRGRKMEKERKRKAEIISSQASRSCHLLSYGLMRVFIPGYCPF